MTQERIYPHRFIFDNSYENEFFSIVDAKHEEEISKRPKLKITIFMKSNWDESKKIEVVFDNYHKGYYRVENEYFKIDLTETYRFENKDPKIARKNANHLLRFIKEYIEDELKDFKEREWKINVHDFYKS